MCWLSLWMLRIFSTVFITIFYVFFFFNSSFLWTEKELEERKNKRRNETKKKKIKKIGYNKWGFVEQKKKKKKKKNSKRHAIKDNFPLGRHIICWHQSSQSTSVTAKRHHIYLIFKDFFQCCFLFLFLLFLNVVMKNQKKKKIFLKICIKN